MISKELHVSPREEFNESEEWSGNPSDSEDDGDLLDITGGNDLIGIGNTKTVHLSLLPSYAPTWTSHHAWRELFQNWRDGIIKRNELLQNQLVMEKTEEGRDILIRAYHPQSRDLLGYIRYKSDRGTEDGVVELTNFHARLQLWHLTMGGTSKARNKNQAGEHGEGLDIAGLVLCRSENNYGCRMVSGGYRWNFTWATNKRLVTKLSRCNRDNMKKEREEAEGKPRTTKSQAWNDVSVFIGGRRKNGKGKKVPLVLFREWLKMTIDIDSPQARTRTPRGDLITDPEYSNKLYLRGLLLPQGSTVGRPLRYGYNFLQGETGRDREGLKGANSQNLQVTAIWAAALSAAGPNSELLAAYTELLLDWESYKYADVMMDTRYQYLDAGTATMVWNYMRKMTPEKPPFYHNSRDTAENIQTIERNLKQYPVAIGNELWKTLRRYRLCRTPFEEQQHRFENAHPVGVPNTIFATHIEWMLLCCFASDESTRNMQLVFVQGNDLGVDVAKSGSVWKIQSDWLVYDKMHQHAFCEAKSPAETGLFSCDHVVLWLWDLILAQNVANDRKHDITKTEGYLKGRAITRLSQMPRNITCAPNNHCGQLVVTWESVESMQNSSEPIRIILHSHGCTGDTSISGDTVSKLKLLQVDEERTCSCPTQVSYVGNTAGVVFMKLDPEEKYYPKVSRDFEGAFFGVASTSVQPASESVEIETTEDQIMNDLNELNDAATVSRDAEDNDSLYQDPTPPGSPSITMGSSPATLARVSTSVDRATIEVEDSVLGRLSVENPSAIRTGPMPPPWETYVVGSRIEHGELDWGGSFPGSHHFYRARNDPDNVLIAKPKPEVPNQYGKRTSGNTTRMAPKKARYEP